jgi:hypothetical protein
MKRLIYLLVILLSGTALHAQRDTITAERIGSFVGKNVQLCDMVKNGHLDNISKDEPTVVYVGDTYETRTLALIFDKNDLKNFSFDPEKKMPNHKFCVNGKVAMYKGKPAIYVKSEAQLNVED